VSNLHTILDSTGNTPLVKLHRTVKEIRPTVLAKLECLNPSGSVKDRIAVRMIESAERDGKLREGGTIVEPTSGNTGHSLALAAAVKGYRCILVVPEKTSTEKVAVLEAYGAEVVVVPNAPYDSPDSYYAVAERIVSDTPGAFKPNQYFNQENPRAYYETMGPELWEQTQGHIDVLVCGVGTGGTITGTGSYLKERNPQLLVVGADPEGSVLSGHQPHPYQVEGIGKDFVPETFDPKILDRWVRVSDRDSCEMALRISREEGILAGMSSGTALAAAVEVGGEMDGDTTMVVVFPDTGRNYLSKVFSTDWMAEQKFLDRMDD
jgi:cystathionine beta-synthase